MMTRIEQIEQGGARPADMQKAGGGGREARDDDICFGACAHAANLQQSGNDGGL